jgi:amidohydrolase
VSTPPAGLFEPHQRAALLALRRDLHRHPELAFQETATAARLERALQAITPDVRRVGETGVVARVPGRSRHGPAVALRGDIDALPIAEETGVPFASEVPGVMHACGHDVHAAWTVGAAQLLVAAPAVGDVVILLQPAEEVGRGALAVLASGVLDGVAAIVGAHVDMRLPVGEVVADAGPVAASTDEFSVTIVGQGAHAARPHEARDPIVAAAALVGALQTVVARRLPPGEPAVVTVATLRAGTATNVIPDRATLGGTLRAVRPATRAALSQAVQEIAAAVARAHGVEASVVVTAGTPPLVNLSGPIAWAREAVTAVLGSNALVPLPTPNLGGEDFACYLERIPGCFLRVGARLPDQAPIPAHTSRFLPDEGAIFVGAAVLAEAARRASAGTPSR